jgi:hypothetical protein
VQLPDPELGNIRVASVSDDAKWLAISETTRGGVFNLQNGARVTHVRNFGGAWFGPDQKMWADFPKFEKTERGMVTVDTSSGAIELKREMKDEVSRQRGPYMVVFKDQKKGDTREMEVRDVPSNNVLWSRTLKGNPGIDTDWVNGTMVIRASASSPIAKEAAAKDTAVMQKLSVVKNRDNSMYFEVLDLKTGKLIGSVIWNADKLLRLVGDVTATHDYLFSTDAEGRLRVVSISTGDEVTTMFAENADVSSDGMLAVEPDTHHVELYDLSTMEKLDEYAFASSVALLQFQRGSGRLVIVTRDQNVIITDPAAAANVAAKQ